jgi:EAL domain-containing protein (putative c-di-GMP-specific phosphodiesterase class I)
MNPRRTPDVWFNAAHDAGVGLELELHAIERSLRAMKRLQAPLSLSLNASPQLIASGRLESALKATDLSRIVLEITEHASVTDYETLMRALAPLRARGALLAIDDVGAGFASMRHILNLKAEIITRHEPHSRCRH